MKQFFWTPGDGVDASASERLRLHFRRPSEPMGEAWFMGTGRRMFHELLADLEPLSTAELQKPLVAIASGTSSFGPMPEWSIWYHYLLAALLPRSHEAYVSYLLENLLTGFMALYPNGVHREPYRGFRDDAVLTLGRCLMDGHCWNGRDIVVGTILHSSNNNPNRAWGWWDASGDFAASMFFCLKYLPEASVAPWLRSVLEITSPHWRAQVMAWMVGAHDILSGAVKWPSEFPRNARPSVRWDCSDCLRPELAAADDSAVVPTAAFIPEGCRLQALGIFQTHFVEDIYLDWLMSISTVPPVEAELAEIPTAFEKLYVRGRQSLREPARTT